MEEEGPEASRRKMGRKRRRILEDFRRRKGRGQRVVSRLCGSLCTHWCRGPGPSANLMFETVRHSEAAQPALEGLLLQAHRPSGLCLTIMFL